MIMRRMGSLILNMEGELYCGLSHSYFLMIFISAALNIPVSIISVFLFLF